MREADAEKQTGHLPEAEMEMRIGIEVFKLNLLAYPDSADAHYNLADAYLQVGEKALARQYAEKALAMIDSHAAPLSSWSDTEQRRAEVRSGVEDLLKKLDATPATLRHAHPAAPFALAPNVPRCSSSQPASSSWVPPPGKSRGRRVRLVAWNGWPMKLRSRRSPCHRSLWASMT